MAVVESPAPILNRELLTGHYREGRGYRGWRERGTDDWLLILTLSGVGRIGHPTGIDLEVVGGDAVLLAPGTRHDYGTAKGAAGWEILWAHFYPRPSWANLLRWPEEAPGLMRVSLREDRTRRIVETRLREVHEYAIGPLSLRDRFAMNALEEVLLWCAESIPEPSETPTDTRLSSAIDYVRSHYREKVSLDEIARASGISQSRMTQLFRRHLGVTAIQYLESHRFAMAKQLLVRTALPVKAVSAEVGFENPFYFTLRFKQHTGLSPTQWRAHQLSFDR